MTFAYPSVPSTAAQRSEQLPPVIYELLDAHSDAQRLMREHPSSNAACT